MNLRSRVGALAAAAALSLTAAACGATEDHSSMAMGGTTGTTAGAATAGGPAAVDTAHNDADVTFAQQMIVHHEGAVAMADLAPDRAQRPEVKALAQKIKAAQAPEIEQMTGWLQAWGAAPMTRSSGMAGMAHGSSTGDHGSGSGGAMPGMMTDEQMQQLSAATGADFDTVFLEMMIAHHEGALEMSETEKAAGRNTDALTLAGRITTSQTAEIAEMKSLLAGR